ncbi:CCR4-NOT transcription complex subunit 7/8 [Angomonas deanei]|uniref:poly(A)-specific ribonuclease n=1 Tax=Angomonas deanei TaxID=59799 RepID=S9X397_9TRYP|nr:CCR4-NOT transcription complex subunit 7/8 [Angomonas deanei]EPY42870.1 CCR4-NOT transcription complex subunit 7/8 [Angomonas deanei]CAD2220570.1 CAF1 family ribonuclease, putative [Angomonas deanei]|eukprot:EPY38078.1 CCR4-NOT transcription complex subunit 7/8 [Angomonas deanei]
MTFKTPTKLPSLSKSPMIRDVWEANLEEEFANIRALLKDYPYIAMDTEFPGVVAKPVGSFKTTHEFYYQTMKCNVNILKLIQLGFTLLNEKGEVPENCCTWQFNFRFNLKVDMYTKESIDLLQVGGIDFEYLRVYGVDVGHFAELLISSGMILNPDVRWLAFQAGYDFGYLTKVICNKELPDFEDDFLQTFHTLFPSMFDLKYLLRGTDKTFSYGLDALADNLKLRRFGTQHQAGSDSLLTGHCYFKLLRECFNNTTPIAQNGIVCALREDAASAVTPSSTANISSSLHGFTPSNMAYGNANTNFPSTPMQR